MNSRLTRTGGGRARLPRIGWGLSLRARLLAITVALLVAGLAMISSVLVRQLETQLRARVDAQLSPMGTALSSVPPELATALAAMLDNRAGQRSCQPTPKTAAKPPPAAPNAPPPSARLPRRRR